MKLEKFIVEYRSTLYHFSEPKLADTKFCHQICVQPKFGKLGIFKSRQIMLHFFMNGRVFLKRIATDIVNSNKSSSHIQHTTYHFFHSALSHSLTTVTLDQFYCAPLAHFFLLMFPPAVKGKQQHGKYNILN